VVGERGYLLNSECCGWIYVSEHVDRSRAPCASSYLI
jgi:hypothetical protein